MKQAVIEQSWWQVYCAGCPRPSPYMDAIKEIEADDLDGAKQFLVKHHAETGHVAMAVLEQEMFLCDAKPDEGASPSGAAPSQDRPRRAAIPPKRRET